MADLTPEAKQAGRGGAIAARPALPGLPKIGNPPARSLEVSFFVRGKPYPKGSPAILRNRSTGKPFVREKPSEKSWEAAIRVLAQLQSRRSGWVRVEEGPVRLELDFMLHRSGKREGEAAWLAAHKPHPDVDKLARAVGDALEGVIYRDDCQVTECLISKRVVVGDEETGVWIRATRPLV